MVNKKLMALAGVFLLLAIGSRAYIKAHPTPIEPAGFQLEELLAEMEPRSDGEILYNLDGGSAEGTVVNLHGWALMEGHSTEFTNVVIGLREEGGTLRVFQTEKSARPDVAAAFGDSLYEGSGFSASCDMAGFPAGSYMLVLYLTDAEQAAYYEAALPGIVSFDGSAAVYATE